MEIAKYSGLPGFELKAEVTQSAEVKHPKISRAMLAARF